MPHTLRLAAVAALLIAFAVPAFAGATVPLDRAPQANTLAPAENCPYDKARAILQNNQMAFIADVPRTATAYLFIVKWKGEVDGASVNVFNCHVDITRGVAKRRPWCAYLPGPKLSCPLTTTQ